MATRTRIKSGTVVQFPIHSVDRQDLIGEVVKKLDHTYLIWIEGMGVFTSTEKEMRILTSEEEMIWRLEQ